VGVYAGGSYALGNYVPGPSDLDVAAVVRAPVPRALADATVAAIRHEALPCPARGLEFVLYPLAVTRGGTTEAGFLLNLNTGAGIPFRVDLDGAGVERHWFPIDRGIYAAHGFALSGPPAAEVFAPVPRRELLPLLAEALEWHEPGSARGADVVLNAARSLRYALDGVWSSKQDAGEWALEQLGHDDAVAQALAARAGGQDVGPAAADRFRLSALACLRDLVHTPG
jgi:Domain of unknown function (DUF4111)/Nucleotidyltransferase domain